MLQSESVFLSIGTFYGIARDSVMSLSVEFFSGAPEKNSTVEFFSGAPEKNSTLSDRIVTRVRLSLMISLGLDDLIVKSRFVVIYRLFFIVYEVKKHREAMPQL